MVEAPGGGPTTGFSSSVVKAHYAAGSLYAFTFSEFLEGLIFVALELPAAPGLERDANGLTSEYVLQQVHWLLHDKVLPNVKKGEVLEFRRRMVESSVLAGTLDAVNPMLDPVYQHFAELPMKGKYTGGTGLALKAFLDMCQESDLVGHSLSHVNVKTCFVNSLNIAADSDVARKPLLDRSEFAEAVLRLAFKYNLNAEPPAAEGAAAEDGPTPRKGGRAVRKALESLAKPAKGHKDAAVKLAAKVEAKLSPRIVPVNAPAEAGEGGGASSLAEGGGASSLADFEAAIVEKLPTVCGKLLSLLETM